MRAWLKVSLAVMMVWLAGCAATPQMPVPFDGKALSTQTGRVGVVMAKVPPVDTYLPGAGCLLCYAAASVANGSLTAHAKTLNSNDLLSLPEEAAKALRKRGAQVVVIAEQLQISALLDAADKSPGRAPKSFATLQKQYNIDRLMVIDLSEIGFMRAYSGYVPTSDPKGYIKGQSYLIDLKDNRYEWFLPVLVTRAAAGAWDEPKFPGLTNAYYQAVETARDNILTPLSE